MTNYFTDDPLRGPAWTAARRLWENADVTPADVNVAQLYDAFSPLIPLSLEGYGFCERGEGGPFTDDGGIEWPTAACPVNTVGRRHVARRTCTASTSSSKACARSAARRPRRSTAPTCRSSRSGEGVPTSAILFTKDAVMETAWLLPDLDEPTSARVLGGLRARRAARAGVRVVRDAAHAAPADVPALPVDRRALGADVGPRPRSGRSSLPHPPLLPAFAEVAPYNAIIVELEEDPLIRFAGNLVDERRRRDQRDRPRDDRDRRTRAASCSTRSTTCSSPAGCARRADSTPCRCGERGTSRPRNWIAWTRAPASTIRSSASTVNASSSSCPNRDGLPSTSAPAKAASPRALRARGHTVVEIDGSPRMAAASVELGGQSIIADVARVPLRSGVADLAIAFMSFQDVDDYEAAFREAARILAPGGRFVFAIVHPINSAGEFRPAAPGEQELDRPFVMYQSSYFEPRLYADDVERNGLPMRFASAHRPLEAYSRALEGAGFLIAAIREIGEAEGKWTRMPLFLDVAAREALIFRVTGPSR